MLDLIPAKEGDKMKYSTVVHYLMASKLPLCNRHIVDFRWYFMPITVGISQSQAYVAASVDGNNKKLQNHDKDVVFLLV